jgi:hypothetical protein
MQFPIALKEGAFLNAVTEIRSDHAGVSHRVSPTHPERGGGTVNTYKMEVPEGKQLDDPVMRIWRAPDGATVYRIYDASSPDGTFIMQKLEEGRHTNPPQTTVATPRAPAVRCSV